MLVLSEVLRALQHDNTIRGLKGYLQRPEEPLRHASTIRGLKSQAAYAYEP
jgi:hypothetical protein